MTATRLPTSLDLPHDDRFLPSIIREFLKDGRRTDLISLAGGLPANGLIPVEHIGMALQRGITRSGATALQYGESAGDPGLLTVLASSLDIDPSRLLITNGSQQALSLVLAALDPGEISGAPPMAAIEDPGYLGALQVVRAHRYTPLSIPVDGDGLCVDTLEERLAAGVRIQACYVNPTFQNPTGAVLSRTRADRLLELAERYGFAVIADDPYRKIHFDAAADEPFRPSPNLIRLGSLSKTLAPGLRLGWLDAEPSLITRVERAKQAADLHTNSISQLVAADLLADLPWWSNHLTSLRAGYRTRRDHLVEALQTEFSEAAFSTPRGGFFCWVKLPTRSPNDSAALLTRSLANHASGPVGFVPGSAFSASGSHAEFVRLSYSNADPACFGEAVRRLSILCAHDPSR